jgi:hypothetical protein
MKTPSYWDVLRTGTQNPLNRTGMSCHSTRGKDDEPFDSAQVKHEADAYTPDELEEHTSALVMIPLGGEITRATAKYWAAKRLPRRPSNEILTGPERP